MKSTKSKDLVKEFLEYLLIQKVKPMDELNECLLDEVADTDTHGPRPYAISTAMGAQIREIVQGIGNEIDLIK